MLIFNFLIFLTLICHVWSFNMNTLKSNRRNSLRQPELSMRWVFGGEIGSMADLGCVGSEQEYYFHPQKPIRLIAPNDAIGKQRVIALLPYNNVLTPGGADRLNLFEMKHRQLLSDTGDANFGIAYYNTALQKISIVGTLARVKSQKVFDDGRVYVLIEGKERFFIEEIISERPYIKARVRTFKDYSDSKVLLDKLEHIVFDEARCTFKFLEMLFPEQNYSIHAPIMKHRPLVVNDDIRTINLLDDAKQLSKSMKFSFAIMDIIKSEPNVKVALLQEHVTERRLAKLKSIVEKGSKFLINELIEKKGYTQEQINDVRLQVIRQDQLQMQSSLLNPSTPSGVINSGSTSISNKLASIPENFINGQWVQRPTFFD